jgi:hypothetical protein
MGSVDWAQLKWPMKIRLCGFPELYGVVQDGEGVTDGKGLKDCLPFLSWPHMFHFQRIVRECTREKKEDDK